MKVCIVGAGSVGAVLGGKLAAAGSAAWCTRWRARATALALG